MGVAAFSGPLIAASITDQLRHGGHTSWLNTVLRTRSAPLLDGLARAVSPRWDAAGLQREVLDGGLAGRLAAPRAAGVLATVWATSGDPVAMSAGHRLLRRIIDDAGAQRLTPAQRQIFAQVSFHVGALDDVEWALTELPDLKRDIRWSLRTDLLNPLLGTPDASGAWVEALGEPFRAAGLVPVRVDGSGPTAFDGLSAEDPGPAVDGPLVSVIMPCFRPDEGLLTSVRSILTQTHAALEILLVDDASGPEYDELFDRCAALDERVRLVRQPVNGGTYLARNAALQQARGTYVTIQDADDWSHPRRLADQVRTLEEDPSLGASRSDAIRATDELVLQWIGYQPRRRNASSLMFRRSAVERIGPFDAVRKGADSEYHERLKYLVGPVGDSHTPLAITRLRAGTLSRSDFTYQRMAPERVLYQAAYRAWHRRLRADSTVPTTVGDPARRPFTAPPSFLRGIGEVPPQDVDVLLVLDASRWPTANAALDLLELLPGARVGMMLLEDAQRPRTEQPIAVGKVMTAINDGIVAMVSPSEPTRARTTAVLSPGVLVLPPAPPPRVDTERLLALAWPPTVKHGVTDLGGAEDGARAWFGTRPTWCAPDAATQELWQADGWALPLLVEELARSRREDAER